MQVPDFPMNTSAVTEFLWICDRSWLDSLSTSIAMVGILLGALTSGFLGDIIGRLRYDYQFEFRYDIIITIHKFFVIQSYSVICHWMLYLLFGYFFCERSDGIHSFAPNINTFRPRWILDRIYLCYGNGWALF